ncbi:hypothetical protein NL676_016398 [Syzygium grande]|nr:hypothetical protein NL676_016398 [Syzygium grande]
MWSECRWASDWRSSAGSTLGGLWLGLLAAQASCLVTMLAVLGFTDWERQAQRAQELTSAAGDQAAAAAVVDSEEVEAKKPLIAEIKEDSLNLSGDLEDADHQPRSSPPV